MESGPALRDLREQLGLTLRDVEAASIRLAELHNNPDLALPISRISEMETKGTVPSIFRLYSLAAIYRTSLQSLLRLFGLDLRQLPSDYSAIAPPRTHKVRDLDTLTAYVPTKLDPGFDPSLTTNFGRMIMRWGAVPMAFLEQFEATEYTYGYVGTEDFTMFPLLLPGSFVQIDESKNKVIETAWRTEYERPIYFVQTRQGYTCCWCGRDGQHTLLVAHPLSPVRTRVLRSERDVEVIGQVVAVAMRLDWDRESSGSTSKLLSKSN